MDVRVALRQADHLGEGPCWLADTEELLRVDITAGAVHRWSPTSGTQRTQHFDGEVGAAVPRAEGGFVLAVGRRLELVEVNGTRRIVAEVEAAHTHNRFNDCRADPAGRLWAGTMSKARQSGVAALYRLEPGGDLVPALVGLTLSNGMGWSPDGGTMYHIDSTSQQVDCYDFDVGEGQLSGKRRLAAIDPADGLPDGLCVDAEGGIWVSLFGGGAVRRFNAQGALTAVVELPVTNPTCPAFGGAALETLYITTARHRLAPDQLQAEPDAGSVLEISPGIRGLRSNSFAG